MGALQMALLMVENHHLDHAAFMAARHGAVSHGDMGQVRRAYAKAATPLFVGAGSGVDSRNAVERVTRAYAFATADIAAFARIRLLSPTAAAAEDFSIGRDGARVIPNDALEYRSNVRGTKSGVSIQRANVLRVEFVYCRPLIVPFAGALLSGVLRRLDPDPWHQSCYAADRVPLRSEGVAPMQSDFRVIS